MHATITARDFLLANFYPSGPFTYFFSTTSPQFHRFLCGPAKQIVTLLDAGSRVECSRNINRLQHMCYCFFLVLRSENVDSI